MNEILLIVYEEKKPTQKSSYQSSLRMYEILLNAIRKLAL